MITNRKRYLIKRIIITNLISLLIVAFVYVWVVYILSHANSFWDLIRGKEVYEQADTIPPVKPFLNPISKAIQESSIDVTGIAEPGVKITLFIDQSETESTTADGDGNFSFPNIPVGTFSTNIYVKAIDETGNTSEPSSTYTVIQDTTPPEYEITLPSKKESVYKSTGQNFTIKGKTEPTAIVTVNDQQAIVNQEGEFTTVLRLQKGGNTLKFVIKDEANNEVTEDRYVNLQKIE